MLTRRTTADVALAPRMALSMNGVERDRRLPDNSVSRVQQDFGLPKALFAVLRLAVLTQKAEN